MDKKLILAGVFGIAVVGAIAFLASGGGKTRPLDHHVILASVSDSDACTCSCIVGIAQEILNKHDYKTDLLIELFQSGNSATANEPVRLGSPIKIFSGNQAMEVGGDRIKNQKRDALTAIRSACEKMQVKDVSPIYISSKAMVEHLRNSSCNIPDSRCHAWIASDLEETEEPGLVDAINGKDRGRPLPPKLVNASIEVTMCGMDQTIGKVKDRNNRDTWKTKKRDAQHVDLITKLWSSQFTNPTAVEIRHFCPEAEN